MVGDRQTGYIVVPYGAKLHAELDARCNKTDRIPAEWVRAFRLLMREVDPENLDSGLSEISIVFQAAVPKLVASKYTTSGVRRPSEL